MKWIFPMSSLDSLAAGNLPIVDQVHIGFQNNRQPLFQTEIKEVDIKLLVSWNLHLI